jgi:aldoxime dehydratase
LSGKFGTWRETLNVPYDRHETIYSEDWYRIGIGRTANSVVVPITTNGFFGAARDRIPLSAIDELHSPFGETVPHARKAAGKGQRLQVHVPVNMVTLRSGQYWAHAENEQLSDYVDNMRPRLMSGINYLLENKEESGTLALRVLTNLDDDGSERKETSVVAHFLSLAHLEKWAASHKTHLDIYRHAIAMNRQYKSERQFVSWHELFVSQGALFEYANCHERTGLLPFFDAIAVT